MIGLGSTWHKGDPNLGGSHAGPGPGGGHPYLTLRGSGCNKHTGNNHRRQRSKAPGRSQISAPTGLGRPFPPASSPTRFGLADILGIWGVPPGTRRSPLCPCFACRVIQEQTLPGGRFGAPRALPSETAHRHEHARDGHSPPSLGSPLQPLARLGGYNWGLVPHWQGPGLNSQAWVRVLPSSATDQETGISTASGHVPPTEVPRRCCGQEGLMRSREGAER